MANLLLLIDNGFEDMEALYPYYRMVEAGHRVVVVGHGAETFKSEHGYPLKADKAPADIDMGGYKAVIVPGGRAPDRMRTKADMVRLLKEADTRGLYIAAICHGPQMLIEAAIVRGKKMTCFKSVKTDLVNAGGLYLDEPVVVDNRFVTSRQPSDLPDFCRALVQMLG